MLFSSNITSTPRSFRCLTVERRSTVVLQNLDMDFVPMMSTSPSSHFSISALKPGLSVFVPEIPRSMKTPPSTHPGVEVIRFFRNADWASRECAELNVSTDTLAYPATRMRAGAPFFFVSIAVIFMVQYITLILYLVKGYERLSAYISSRCKPAP